MEDIQEYQTLKREQEAKKNKTNSFGATPDGGAGPSNGDKNAGKSRTALIHERIGYNPVAKKQTWDITHSSINFGFAFQILCKQ